MWQKRGGGASRRVVGPRVGAVGILLQTGTGRESRRHERGARRRQGRMAPRRRPDELRWWSSLPQRLTTGQRSGGAVRGATTRRSTSFAGPRRTHKTFGLELVSDADEVAGAPPLPPATRSAAGTSPRPPAATAATPRRALAGAAASALRRRRARRGRRGPRGAGRGRAIAAAASRRAGTSPRPPAATAPRAPRTARGWPAASTGDDLECRRTCPATASASCRHGAAALRVLGVARAEATRRRRRDRGSLSAATDPLLSSRTENS